MGKQTTTFYMNERANCVKSLFIFKMKNNIAFFCAHVIMLFRVHLKNSMRLRFGVFSFFRYALKKEKNAGKSSVRGIWHRSDVYPAV